MAMETMSRRAAEAAVARQAICKGLSAEQQAVFQRTVEKNESLLLIGAAGTGKSHLTRAIRDGLRHAHRRVATCAPFGVAACNVDGFTVHSTFALNVGDVEAWRSLPQGSREKAKMMEKMLRRTASKRKPLWRQMDTLVIDEISTLDADTFDFIELAARKVRASKQPFGGLQVVAVGDFLQLPPVCGRWAFDSEHFRTTFPEQNRVELTQAHRQEAGSPFFEALQCLRTVDCRHPDQVAAIREKLRNTCVPIASGAAAADMSEAGKQVRLVPLRAMAEEWNARCLGQLTDPRTATFHAIDSDPFIDDELAAQAPPLQIPAAEILRALSDKLQHCRMAKEVELRVGARVMMLANTEAFVTSAGVQSVANGHTGTIINFVDSARAAVRDAATYQWAQEREAKGLPAVLPVVRWDHMKTPSPVLPLATTVGDALTTHGVCRTRTQIPLQLAWAITTHKCQGMTLQGDVTIDLRGGWTHGQGYVALSRTRSGAHTHIAGLDTVMRPLTADPRALKFVRNC